MQGLQQQLQVVQEDVYMQHLGDDMGAWGQAHAQA